MSVGLQSALRKVVEMSVRLEKGRLGDHMKV